jgi:type I restriction enzyme R subunit
MPRLTADSEDALEQATLALFRQMGWDTVNCLDEVFGSGEGDAASQRLPQPPPSPRRPNLGRETTGEVVLNDRLKSALRKLNPDLPAEALQQASDILTRDRSALSPVEANREVYQLLKEGVKVKIDLRGFGNLGGLEPKVVRVIDWDTPTNNDFLVASQLWITGPVYKRRADLIGFVNGLPLVFIELKAAHRHLTNAYHDNLRDYKNTIPQLFWYNVFIILSNGSRSVMGSLTADWEHFADWKKTEESPSSGGIASEQEQGIISLETMLRGVCQPDRLLDFTENFVLFTEAKGGLRKLIAKNHQYLGVNRAIEAVKQIRANQGKLGVFWHTQGSGKSYSMVFFSQKILRKLPGNWTFLVVTDRDRRDRQIYQNFAGAAVVTEPEEAVRAASGEHLRQLLRDDHRYVFTLIQKFRTVGGERYPRLSDRDDIIVMADEAHRTQYDTLALNMRTGLPRAAYIAFTGTPLIAGEERTREVFGDYVSIYNFRQSIEDNATVPLYYENRIPEVELINADLNAQIADVLDRAELGEAAEDAVEREFAREYHVITRDDRLDKIAEDLVKHFLGRGYKGKAMVVSIDKATAVKMYDRVRKYWGIQLAYWLAELETCAAADRAFIEDKIAFLRSTDMAVVVSPAQNEEEDLRKKGADIRPHRLRLNKESLEEKFKDPDDPLRLVFVCAMWMVGFDAPACSTLYLDKPMRDHTLMQTIARANRVFGDKVNGLIVDYIGIFRDLQQALAIYGTVPIFGWDGTVPIFGWDGTVPIFGWDGTASGGGVAAGDLPVEPKAALINQLRQALSDARSFCAFLSIDLNAIQAAEGFERIRLRDDAVNAILIDDSTRQKFLTHAYLVNRLYRAVLPDPIAHEFNPARSLLDVLAQQVRASSGDDDVIETEAGDIAQAVRDIELRLDRSIEASYERWTIDGARPVDLRQIDFETLEKRFKQGHQHIEIEQLRALIRRSLDRLVPRNRSRMDFYDTFQKMIVDYNAGATDAEALFAQLVNFAKQLNEEEQRGIREQLDDEQLAIFDILTRPSPKLTKKEREQVKRLARELLDTLKAERLVLEWRSRQQTRAAVFVAIQNVLENLPQKYSDDDYHVKCEAVYQHVYDSYYGVGRSVYQVPG